MAERKKITILGSTGSIGTQTLDIIEEYPDKFQAQILTAGNNWELLARQAMKFRPETVVIGNEVHYQPLKEALEGTGTEVMAGSKAIAEVAGRDDHAVVVTAMVGYSGLIPTMAAISRGKRIALANKETLVVAGEVITKALEETESDIIPVDSEHSAIFQCLQGEKTAEARKIILTASGGPFLNRRAEELEFVTPADALRHPNWDMGAKVTIDSASMMNKGFEMIEARWLFGCPPEKIEIVVHPQSIVHSMVEFDDGSVKAQLGVPDMHLPIRYALSYPERFRTERNPLSLTHYRSLTFEAPDMVKFPMLGLAYKAIGKGGTMPCVLNAANERAVAAFLRGEIRFTDLPTVAIKVMESAPFIKEVDIETLINSNTEALRIADSVIDDIKKHR